MPKENMLVTDKKITGFNKPFPGPSECTQACKCKNCGTRWVDTYMGYGSINGVKKYDSCSECVTPNAKPIPEETVKK